MADSRDQKWHSILKLALSVGSDVVGEHRSKLSFAAGDGAVGLAIVASLSEEPPAYRSEPIRIGAVVTKPSLRAAASRKDEGAERFESYTRVISCLGGNRAKKRVYFGVGDGDGEGGLLLKPPSPPEDPPFVVTEFLRFCFGCKKQLDGMDVYMYRGKAFCSEECRYQQMLVEEFGEKLSTGTSRNYKHSSSPCSASLLVTAGIAAA